jgi:hypothetical protein
MPHAPDYLAAIDAFTEAEDCFVVDLLVENPRCVESAERFGKTPMQVALDINRRCFRES